MATKRITKKNIKKTMVVNLTDAVEAYDVYLAVAMAKIDKVLDYTEFDAIVNHIADRAAIIATVYFQESTPEVNTPEVNIVKKPNIFKRFWNWITRKK